jgi:hypothetical protein
LKSINKFNHATCLPSGGTTENWLAGTARFGKYRESIPDPGTADPLAGFLPRFALTLKNGISPWQRGEGPSFQPAGLLL